MYCWHLSYFILLIIYIKLCQILGYMEGTIRLISTWLFTLKITLQKYRDIFNSFSLILYVRPIGNADWSMQCPSCAKIDNISDMMQHISAFLHICVYWFPYCRNKKVVWIKIENVIFSLIYTVHNIIQETKMVDMTDLSHVKIWPERSLLSKQMFSWVTNVLNNDTVVKNLCEYSPGKHWLIYGLLNTSYKSCSEMGTSTVM